MRKHVRHLVLLLALWLVTSAAGPASGQPPLNPDLFQAGVYADDARTLNCITGSAGDRFDQVIWAWVPDSRGLAYITLRLELPANLDLSARPRFNELVGDVIITEYNNGTSEWNMLLEECPSGWVRVFSQECVLLDDQPARIGIQAEHSMMRDCTFFLNDLAVLAELSLNDPGCEVLSRTSISWSSVKSIFR